MKHLLLAFSCTLTGCALMPTRLVEVPIPVACVDDIPVRPGLVSDAELKVMNDYQLPLALFRDRKQREVYMAEVEGLLLACKVTP